METHPTGNEEGGLISHVPPAFRFTHVAGGRWAASGWNTQLSPIPPPNGIEFTKDLIAGWPGDWQTGPATTIEPLHLGDPTWYGIEASNRPI